MYSLTAVRPEFDRKALLQWVEWQIATRALGVVIRAGELGSGGLEAAAGDERGLRDSTESRAGEHLYELAKKTIDVELSPTVKVWVEWRGGWSRFL